MKKYFDLGTIVIILITFILFLGALCVKGLSHDLFLEAGVFLVSLKLIMTGYKNHLDLVEIKKKLDEIIAQQLK